jgi:hypothetical protein
VLREVLIQHGVRGFFFTENNLRGEIRAELLRKALPEMRAIVREHAPPFVASLTTEGHAHVIFDRAKHKQVLRKQKAANKKFKTKRKGTKIDG